MTFFYLAPWIVFFPAIGLLINLIFGSRFSEKVIGTIASLAVGLAFVASVLLAYSLTQHPDAFRWTVGEWIHVGTLQLDWTFRIDTLSTTMMLVVSGVGTLIHIYAIGYMHEDVRFKSDLKRFSRFFVFLNLFIVMMMILVGGDSYLMLFIGWEGVGLCSFLLIGFWYEMDALGQPSWANSDAAKKAMIANRIGDFGFLIAAFLMFWAFHSLQFDQVFQQAPAIAASNPGLITAITLFLLLGVTGKSAQIPLFVWLPDAMAGPTPVSALIHAATMVTAGVYLITRSAALYVTVPAAQYIVAMVGAVTALFAATIAVGQYDIKKVLAYSTISQLGYMVAAVGMGAFAAGMFHLVMHAFFKGLLFLSAGSVILGMERGHHYLAHAHHEERLDKGRKKKEEKSHGDAPEEVFDPNDMRNMGGLRKTMPVTFWTYLIGALALSGIVPFAGFWSKDEILDGAQQGGFTTIYWLLAIAAFFTALYMGRQIFMVFFGEPRHEAVAHTEESPKVITIPLIVLAVLSLVGGGLNFPGVDTLSNWLEQTVQFIKPIEFQMNVALISTGLALLAVLISWLLYGRRPLKAGEIDPLRKMLGPIFVGMERKWFVDEAYFVLFINRYVDVARFTRYVDQLGIDAFFNGLGAWTKDAASGLRRFQNGFVRSYALFVLISVVAILGYLIFK